MSASRKVYLKVAVLGDGGVGKTSLMNRFVYDTFVDNYRPTIGVEFLTKDILIDERVVTLQIWDISGTTDYPNLIRLFSREADCCILVYDVADTKTFNTLDARRNEFLTEVVSERKEKFPFAVIGNKIDQAHRNISIREALEWCNSKQSMPYFETTAKDGSLNVQEVFYALAKTSIRYLTEQDCI